jgi:hypothetical protein
MALFPAAPTERCAALANDFSRFAPFIWVKNDQVAAWVWAPLALPSPVNN